MEIIRKKKNLPKTRDSQHHEPKEKEEATLFCDEKPLTSSPILWPEQVKGITRFVACLSPIHDASPNREPDWFADVNNKDFDLMSTYGSLSDGALMDKVRELHNMAYELGLDEAREMSRGNLLNIFGKHLNTQSSKAENKITANGQFIEKINGFVE